MTQRNKMGAVEVYRSLNIICVYIADLSKRSLMSVFKDKIQVKRLFRNFPVQ
jgi:hypothetical protein